jgi:hypothetical protein
MEGTRKMPHSKRRLAAGVTCAALAASAAVLTAPMAAQAAPAAPAISLGNYTCYWSINLRPDGRTGHPHWAVDVPVTCNGVMDVIAISVSGLNPSGYINWNLTTNPPCYGTATCDIRTAADGFDQKVEACIAVRVRAASASECKTKDVV